MKQKIVKIVFALSFLMVEIFGLVSLTPNIATASSASCAAQISFDVNPKSGANNTPFTISGSVTVNNLLTDNGSLTGTCPVPNSNTNALNVYVTVYDKTTGNRLLSDIVFPLTYNAQSGQPAQTSQTFSLPNNTFTPSSSWNNGNIPSSLQVAAMVKVTDGSNNWPVLTESSPVGITLTQAATSNVPNGGGCTDFSQCASQLCTNAGLCRACTSNADCNASDEVGYTCNVSQGVCVAPTAATTNLPNGATCTDFSQCASQLCTNAGLCRACTSDPDCNAADEVGYTCNVSQGVCVAPVTSASGANAATPNSTTPCTDPTSCLYDPLPESDLVHAFLLVAQGLLSVLGVLAVVFIIVGGFQMIVGSGSEEAITKAKKTITWAILGLVVAILSFSIIAIVESLLQAQIQPTTVVTPTTTQSTPAKSP